MTRIVRWLYHRKVARPRTNVALLVRTQQYTHYRR